MKNNENVVNTERGEGASSSKLSSDTSNDEHVNISPKRGGKDRLNVRISFVYCILLSISLNVYYCTFS